MIKYKKSFYKRMGHTNLKTIFQIISLFIHSSLSCTENLYIIVVYYNSLLHIFISSDFARSYINQTM